ncbi:MAG TPA: HAMP domain-containing sensor histidine kinase, partial [Burkholderiaceae bacterium]|nr:HAMP domain-containing sensor histidine kinase [Burkholderiaceae bacterium]
MSLPLTSPVKSQTIKPDLMGDPRVRAVIKENLYRGMLVRPIIVTATVILFWYLLVVWPNNLRLMLALGIWGTNSILYLALHLYHRFQDINKRQLPEASSMYLKLLVLNCWIDCAALGFVGLLIAIERPDFESMVVIGLIMYMFSAFIKNISYATASRFLPALVFMPVTIAFLMRGDVAHIIIALYFIISTFSLSVYGASAATAIQLPIKQQYEIAEQNEALSQLTTQLSIERDRADAANAAKSHFFTAASHDARQPLQAISLLFDGFKMSAQTNLQDKKIIEKIEVNLNTIRHLFDRVLDISRIDSGHVTPEIKNFSLQKLFNKLDAQFGELAASKGLWLHFVPTDAWVEHDSELLDRIVSNLVHNAIKYTSTGGVWVAWRQTRGRLEIRDSGLGISKEDQATIFNEFAQVNNPARNNEAGLGLGLSIVKRLAELT